MPVAFNLRGIGTCIVCFGLLLFVGNLIERRELASTGQVLAVTIIGGALLCSLFAFTTDKCDSPGVFRPYWQNFHQASYEALGQNPPDYFIANPARVTAIFAFPLAVYPHFLAIGMFCFAIPGMMKGKPSGFDVGLWKYLPIAMVSAAMATIYGYATSQLRQVEPINNQTPAAVSKQWLTMRNWQVLCAILVAVIALAALLLGRPFRNATFIGLALGIGPLSLITAILNFDWYFNDRSMQHFQSGAFGLEGPAAARAVTILIGLLFTGFGIALIIDPGLFSFRR